MDRHDSTLPSAPIDHFPVGSSAQTTDAPSKHFQQEQQQHPDGDGGDSGGDRAPSTLAYTDESTASIKARHIRRCFNCCTTNAKSWRRSTKNPGKVLCNKCGLYERTTFFGNPVRRLEPSLRNHAQRTTTSHPYSVNRSSSTDTRSAPDTISSAGGTRPIRHSLEALFPPPSTTDNDNRDLQHPSSSQGYHALSDRDRDYSSDNLSSKGAMDDMAGDLLVEQGTGSTTNTQSTSDGSSTAASTYNVPCGEPDWPLRH